MAVLITVSCGSTASALVAKFVTLVLPRLPPGTENSLSGGKAIFPTALNVLLLIPFLESLLLCGSIEVFRRFRAPFFLQLGVGAVILALTHLPWWPIAVIVAPGFFFQSFLYLRWRETSWLVPLLLVTEAHSLHNLLPFLDFLIWKMHGV